jgi:hypothetical protein
MIVIAVQFPEGARSALSTITAVTDSGCRLHQVHAQGIGTRRNRGGEVAVGRPPGKAAAARIGCPTEVRRTSFGRKVIA